ncbi:MAG TPA: VOC family protein [Gemmatimonadales bacterium]|nr:VOC family protein [Gemmatimonadales bacterium]
MTTALPYGVAPPGYRLPDATRLGKVRLQVADLTRSLSYYVDTLGLRILGKDGSTALLAAHGDDAPLVELVERRGVVPPHGRLGLYHFAILLPDRAALGRFMLHLAQLQLRVGAANHLVSESLYLHDPDGLGIEVYADRPRAEWEHHGRELVLDTLPLDGADVARAAAGQPWSGMPAGTRMGHVHLHVGNLDQAAAFYHASLGMDKMMWTYPGALFLAAGGYHHHLGLNTWAGPAATPPGQGDARLLEWELVLPGAADADAAARSLEAAGFRVIRGDGGWRADDPWRTTLRCRTAD